MKVDQKEGFVEKRKIVLGIGRKAKAWSNIRGYTSRNAY